MNIPPDQSATDSSGRTLYVTHIPPDTSENDLKTLFETYGVVEHCRLCNHSKHSAGLLYGFVRLSTVDEANEAIQSLNSYQLNGWRLEVKFENNTRTDKPQQGKLAEPQRSFAKHDQQSDPGQPREAVYVKGIPKTWTADDLKSLFGLAGEVVSCHMLTSKNTTLETCSAIVKLASVDAAQKAIEFLDNKKPPGSAYLLGVKYAEAQDDKRKEIREKPVPVRSTNQRYAPYNPSDRPTRTPAGASQSEFEQPNQQVTSAVTQQPTPAAMGAQPTFQAQMPSMPMQLLGQNGMMQQLAGQYAMMPFANPALHPGSALSMQTGMPFGLPMDQAMALQGGFGASFGAADASNFQAMQNLQAMQTMQNMQNMQLAQSFGMANQSQPGLGQHTNGGERVVSANTNSSEQELTSIYISGLPFEVDDLFLYKHFAPYGGVHSVKILTDKRTAKPTGAGFVNYTNQAAAEAAHAAMNKVKMNDRVELHIVLQAPRQKTK